MKCTSQNATLHWPLHGPLGLSPQWRQRALTLATAPKTRMKWKDIQTTESKRAENVIDEFRVKKRKKKPLFEKMTEWSLRRTHVIDRSQTVESHLLAPHESGGRGIVGVVGGACRWHGNQPCGAEEPVFLQTTSDWSINAELMDPISCHDWGEKGRRRGEGGQEEGKDEERRRKKRRRKEISAGRIFSWKTPAARLHKHTELLDWGRWGEMKSGWEA